MDAGRIIFIAYFVAVLIVSAIIHEVAHAWMALRFGDTTARDAGRITLNPVPHIDPVFTILIPGMMALVSILSGGGLFILGGAKPVPVNPLRYSKFRAGTFLVSGAGVFANFLIALVVGLSIRFFVQDTSSLMFFILFPFVFANIILAFFNLLPIPPLDGSKVLSAILRLSYAQQAKIERYAMIFFFLLIFLVFTGKLSFLFRGITFVFTLITGVSFSA